MEGFWWASEWLFYTCLSKYIYGCLNPMAPFHMCRVLLFMAKVGSLWLCRKLWGHGSNHSWSLTLFAGASGTGNPTTLVQLHISHPWLLEKSSCFWKKLGSIRGISAHGRTQILSVSPSPFSWLIQLLCYAERVPWADFQGLQGKNMGEKRESRSRIVPFHVQNSSPRTTDY